MKPSRSIRAFTLLEIMVVVAIIGVIFLMGIPAIREAAHREALSQATRDMAEACKQARQRAILGSKPAELRIFPHSGRIEIGDVSTAPATDDAPRPPPPKQKSLPAFPRYCPTISPSKDYSLISLIQECRGRPRPFLSQRHQR